MDLVRIPQVLFILVVVFCLHARSFGNEKLRNLLRAKELKLSEIKEIPKNRKKRGGSIVTYSRVKPLIYLFWKF